MKSHLPAQIVSYNTTKLEKCFYSENAVFPSDYYSMPKWEGFIPLIIDIVTNQHLRIIICLDIKFVTDHYNITILR